jgi:hypothetical protein
MALQRLSKSLHHVGTLFEAASRSPRGLETSPFRSLVISSLSRNLFLFASVSEEADGQSDVSRHGGQAVPSLDMPSCHSDRSGGIS